MTWRAEVLIPAHRIVFALAGGEVVELRGSSTSGTFGAYRGLPGRGPRDDRLAEHRPAHRDRRPIVVDPGYQTQGDMLAAALARARRSSPDDVAHRARDPPALRPRLGAPAARRRRPPRPRDRARDAARPRRARLPATARPERPLRRRRRARCCRACAGSSPPATPTGHVAFLVDTDDGLVAAIAGDTPRPRPRVVRGDGRCPTATRAATSTSPRSARSATPARAVRDPGHNRPGRPRVSAAPDPAGEAAPDVECPRRPRHRRTDRGDPRELAHPRAEDARPPPAPASSSSSACSSRWYELRRHSVTVSGQDVVPSWWILLIFAAAAAAILIAEALNFELPTFIQPGRVGRLPHQRDCFIVTLMVFLEGERRPGVRVFLALLFSLAAVVLVGHALEARSRK